MRENPKKNKDARRKRTMIHPDSYIPYPLKFRKKYMSKKKWRKKINNGIIKRAFQALRDGGYHKIAEADRS